MCETNVYVYDGGKETLFFDNVDVVTIEGRRILLRNLFGEEKVFEGAIKEMHLSKHKIILEGSVTPGSATPSRIGG